jgi:hypothetical protein
VSIEVMLLYFVDGLTVGQIAKQTETSASRVRALLSEGGIRIRRVNQGDSPTRDPVCTSVHRKGFPSFHEFVQNHGLDSFGEQAKLLGVTEKAFVRVYESYRRLLRQLEAAGRGGPTAHRRSDRG